MPATHLHVTRWVDPVVEAEGHAGRSWYVEWFWLPLLGPSATVLLRRLQIRLDADPDGCWVDLDGLSQQLGLGTFESKHAPLPRAISRLVHFGLAKRMAPGNLVLRCIVGPPSQDQLRGLREPLRAVMEEFVRLERAGDLDLPASGPSPTTGPRGG
jgi:hypothetical protein